jgi:hypothetical protein
MHGETNIKINKDVEQNQQPKYRSDTRQEPHIEHVPWENRTKE